VGSIVIPRQQGGGGIKITEYKSSPNRTREVVSKIAPFPSDRKADEIISETLRNIKALVAAPRRGEAKSRAYNDA